MRKFEVGDTVRVLDDYEKITRELDTAREQGQIVGLSDFLMEIENRSEVFEVCYIDKDGDIYLSGKKVNETVVHKETLYLYPVDVEIAEIGIFVVHSVLYDAFNSIDDGKYFYTSYEAHKWVDAKIDTLSEELRNTFSGNDVFVSELKS